MSLTHVIQGILTAKDVTGDKGSVFVVDDESQKDWYIQYTPFGTAHIHYVRGTEPQHPFEARLTSIELDALNNTLLGERLSLTPSMHFTHPISSVPLQQGQTIEEQEQFTEPPCNYFSEQLC